MKIMKTIWSGETRRVVTLEFFTPSLIALAHFKSTIMIKRGGLFCIYAQSKCSLWVGVICGNLNVLRVR